MNAKPSHLSPTNASAFQEPGVAEAYRYRPSYPAETFKILDTLMVDSPRRVLDIGCGTGALARHLIDLAEEIDAIDFSHAMVERGQKLENGDHAHIHWIEGLVENAPLNPPYALITAGESLHWMDWDIIMPRLHSSLSPNGVLALIELQSQSLPWNEKLVALIQHDSTIRDYQPVDVSAELEMRGLYTIQGRRQTTPITFDQSLDAYVESFHGRASFSRARMSKAGAAAFDEAVRDMVAAHGRQTVTLTLIAEIVWGKPLSPKTKGAQETPFQR